MMLRTAFSTVMILASLACNKVEKAKAEPSTSSVEPPPPPAPPKPPTLAEQLMAQTSLQGALSVTKPHFVDSNEGLTPAAAALALWGTSNLRWSELNALPETKFALVMKDSEAERGKRLCAGGSIIEIAVDRSSGSPVYMGGLITPGGKVLRFAALGSTGELVQNSSARFCGVVTGRESYSNSGGGTTHAVFAVGLFDLPENKGQSAH